MTAHVGTMSVDGTPISQADVARIEAEEKLHADHQRRAVMVVAGASNDAAEAREFLSMLGLDPTVVGAARTKRPRKRRAA